MRFLPFALLLSVAACEEGADLLPEDQAGPHFRTWDDIYYDYSPALRAVEVGVLDGPPGRDALVVVSPTGPGAGRCPSSLNGGCLEILPPYFIVSRGAFDSTGRFEATFSVPTSFRGPLYGTVVAPGRPVSGATGVLETFVGP